MNSISLMNYSWVRFLLLYYYYSFPKNEEMRQKWLSNIHVKQKITKNSVVCSYHFEPSCFYTANSRQLLKANAIPTIPPVVRIFYYVLHNNNHVREAPRASTGFSHQWVEGYRGSWERIWYYFWNLRWLLCQYDIFTLWVSFSRLSGWMRTNLTLSYLYIDTLYRNLISTLT